MMKLELCLMIVLAIFTFCGCSGNITIINSSGNAGSEIFQSHNVMDSKVENEQVELVATKYQESNNLSMTKDTDYEIYYEKFIVKNINKQTDIVIEYPQIRNMKFQKIQLKVNKLLKEKAVSVYGVKDIEGLILPMKTKVEYSNSHIISVKYTGYEYYYGAINGNNIMYATNINLNTGEIIDIRNLFTNCYQQKLNRNVFNYNGEFKAGIGEMIDPNSLEFGYVNADESIMLELFKNYYGEMSADNFYFGEKFFNIIVKTPSGPDTYLELAASYDDLKDCMNYNDGFWEDILVFK